MQEVATRGGKLTEAQERLIDALDGEAFAQQGVAGLPQGYEDAQKIGRATRSEPVQAELLARRSAKLRTTLAAKALQTIENLLESEKTPAATRFSAAKWVLEQAGHGDHQDGGKDKPLHEMSEAELVAFMDRAQKVIDAGGDAPVIKVAP